MRGTVVTEGQGDTGTGEHGERGLEGAGEGEIGGASLFGFLREVVAVEADDSAGEVSAELVVGEAIGAAERFGRSANVGTSAREVGEGVEASDSLANFAASLATRARSVSREGDWSTSSVGARYKHSAKFAWRYSLYWVRCNRHTFRRRARRGSSRSAAYPRLRFGLVSVRPHRGEQRADGKSHWRFMLVA